MPAFRDRTSIPGSGDSTGTRACTGWSDIEAFIAPVEGTAQGVVVIDASGLNIGLVRGHIEDEGVYGTAHIALGNNLNFTVGQNRAPIHFDYVFRQPTILLDGQQVMTDGVLADEAG